MTDYIVMKTQEADIEYEKIMKKKKGKSLNAKDVEEILEKFREKVLCDMEYRNSWKEENRYNLTNLQTCKSCEKLREILSRSEE